MIDAITNFIWEAIQLTIGGSIMWMVIKARWKGGINDMHERNRQRKEEQAQATANYK